MEYKKNAEEVRASEEYKNTIEEHHKPTKEYFSAMEEYHKPAREYFAEEEPQKKLSTEPKKEKRVSLMKKVRQMGYLVAASVAVVTVSQTVDPVISHNYEEQTESNRNDTINSGEININVPGLDGYGEEEETDIAVENENAENITSEYLVLTSYDNYSTTNGGVLLIEENGLMGLMSVSGEILCEPKYNGNNWCAPNDDGYSVVEHNGIYYVLDNHGKEVFVWTEGADEFEITDDNIIFIEQFGEFENDVLAKVSYWRTDGTKIREITSMEEEIFYGNAFNDGIAVLNMTSDIENFAGGEPHILFENGTIQKVLNSNGESPYFWVNDAAYADGYYIGYSAEGYALVEVSTGRPVGGAFWTSNIVERYVPGFMYEEIYIKGYYENGQYLYNYGTYGCIEAVNGEETVCILFDFADTNWDTYNAERVIAIYDKIIMDDFKYLIAAEDEQCFYIDWNGNIISEIYEDATAFNEDGYAMIMKESGTVYLINSRFEILDTIENVTSIGNCGDAFGMEWNGESVLYVPEFEIGR